MFQPSELPAVETIVRQPAWMLQTAFYLSSLLAAIKVGEVLWAVFRRPALEVALTKDMFFRHTDQGEIVFLNAILSSSRRPAFVRDVKATLVHTDGSQTIKLKLERLGEPADRGSTVNDHYFFSSSPIDLIPVDNPTRRIYMFAVDDSRNQLVKAFETLRGITYRNVEGARKSLVPVGEDGASENAEALIIAAHTDFVNQGVEGLQIKPGKYVAKVTWTFASSTSKGLARRLFSKEASLSFVVPDGVRERMREELHRTGAREIHNIVQPSENATSYLPVVNPTDITPL